MTVSIYGHNTDLTHKSQENPPAACLAAAFIQTNSGYSGFRRVVWKSQANLYSSTAADIAGALERIAIEIRLAKRCSHLSGEIPCILRARALQLACFLKARIYLSLEAGEEINRDKSWIESCVLNRLAAD